MPKFELLYIEPSDGQFQFVVRRSQAHHFPVRLVLQVSTSSCVWPSLFAEAPTTESVVTGSTPPSTFASSFVEKRQRTRHGTKRRCEALAVDASFSRLVAGPVPLAAGHRGDATRAGARCRVQGPDGSAGYKGSAMLMVPARDFGERVVLPSLKGAGGTSMKKLRDPWGRRACKCVSLRP